MRNIQVAHNFVKSQDTKPGETHISVTIGPMNVESYLDRLGLVGPLEPTIANLELLQRAHLTAVPFENLDVFHRRGVHTSDDWSVSKIVQRGRGGWCFELNGAFAALLSSIGYEVTRLAATVLYGTASPMPTHLSVEVRLDRPYLVDVGFGDSFIKPLPLDSEGPHDGGIGEFGFVFEDGHTTLVSFEGQERPAMHYRFAPEPRELADFEDASVYLQTQPDLQWTKAPFATRLLDGGPARVTLLSDRIKFRTDGHWTEKPVAKAEWAEMLDKWFGMIP